MGARKLWLGTSRLAAFAVAAISLCSAVPARAAVTSLGSVTPVPPAGSGTSTALIVGDEQSPSSDTRGWLNIDGGTTLQYGTLIVGDEEEFTGIVNITGNFLQGQNSSLTLTSQGFTNTPTVQVGNEGTGYLNVRGGTMTLTNNSSNMSIGEEVTGVGYVTVTDPFTQFSLSQNLYVGRKGMGSLEVLNGATFQTTNNGMSPFVSIGSDATGIGTMVVDGLGSVFRAGNKLYVADDGDDSVGELGGVGSLTISHQAIVDVDNGASPGIRVGPLGRVILDGGILIGPTPAIGFGTTINGILEGGGLVRGNVGFNASGTLEVGPGELMQFNGAVSNQGSATIDQGELRFQSTFTNNAQGIFVAPGRISLENGTLRLAVPLTNAGVISSSHGTNNFHGAITNTGRVVVASDTVAVFHDTFTLPASVEVLPRGNALFLANMVFTSTAILEMGVSMDGATDTSGKISVSGAATLGGNLTVDVLGGFTPTLGQTFDLINAGSISGAFSTITVPDIPGILEYRIIYNPTSVQLLVADSTMATLRGDFNGDFAVDAADYIVWRKGLGTIFTQDDYDDWRANFGRTFFGSGSGSAMASTSNGAVPEPAAPTLAFAAFVGLAAVRTGRRKAA